MSDLSNDMQDTIDELQVENTRLEKELSDYKLALEAALDEVRMLSTQPNNVYIL